MACAPPCCASLSATALRRLGRFGHHAEGGSERRVRVEPGGRRAEKRAGFAGEVRLIAETRFEGGLGPRDAGLVGREGAPEPHDPAERLGTDPDRVEEDAAEVPVAEPESV